MACTDNTINNPSIANSRSTELADYTTEKLTLAPSFIDMGNISDKAAILLKDLVADNNSQINLILDRYELFLDRAVELSDSDKQVAYANFIKDIYAQLTSLAVTTALDVEKTNKQLVLESKKVEAAYNETQARIQLIREQTYKEIAETAAVDTKVAIDKEVTVKKAQTEIDMACEQIEHLKKQELELKAKIQRQWGYTIGSDGSLNNDTANTSIYHEQIKGFMVTHLKDLIKTFNDRAALMQNAKVPPTAGENTFVAELTNAVKRIALDREGFGSIQDSNSQILNVADFTGFS